eukprot:Phypoly_transcript_16093.p2 GENE.Phypoly_transcript_16093~~Phypoly_transcript_16093.p2  ORF type:complete len:133 (+),score=10.56 Phypoly_transcript_16093:35-400(+)
MRDKEKRAYLLISCFFVPTCGGIMNTLKPLNMIGEIGLCLVSFQGFLNAIAMNEKVIHDAAIEFYKKRPCFRNFPPMQTLQGVKFQPAEVIQVIIPRILFPRTETAETADTADTMESAESS